MLKTRTQEEIRNEIETLGEAFIDAETEKEKAYLEKVEQKIKSFYVHETKQNREIITKTLQILGIGVSYNKQVFNIFYIDDIED